MNASSISFNPDDLRVYQHELYFNLVLTFFSNSFGIFMVLRHSSKEMSTYRWFLLNIIIWAFLMDLCLTLFFQPYLLLPLFGICFLGIITDFSGNVLLWGYAGPVILLEIAVTCCVSIFIALFYRLSVLFSVNSLFSRLFRSCWGIALVVITGSIGYFYVGFIAVQILVAIDANAAVVRQKYYTDFPGVRAVLDSSHCILATTDDSNIRSKIFQALILACLVILLTLAIFGAAIGLLLYRRTWLSANNYRMHKQFILALSLQIIVPFGSIILPLTTLAFWIYFNLSFSKVADDFLLLLCSSHSTLNVLVMVLSTRPYLRATKGYLLAPFKRFFPNSFQQVVTVKQTAIRRVKPVELITGNGMVGRSKSDVK